ncbi:DNA-directed RNA polymerase [Bertholletia excelsa]
MPLGVLIGINFTILSDLEAEKMSVLTIEETKDVTHPKLGLPNPKSKCETCEAKDVKSCEGHFGVIKFPFTILHPYFISETAQILNRICPGCKSVRHNAGKDAASVTKQRQRSNCKYCNGSTRDHYPRMKFKVSSKDVFGKTAIIVEIKETPTKKSQTKSSRDGLALDYWDFVPKDAQLDESTKTPTSRVLSHAQVYNLLKDVDPVFLKESVFKKYSLLLNCFLVTPNCHRVTELGQYVIFDERTKAFRKMVDFRGTANELSSRVLDGLQTSKLRSEKLLARDPASASSIPGLKHIKELILGKRSNHIFRMVVVGDPNIKLSEIGVPCHVAERLLVSEHLSPWNWEKLNTCCNLRILEKGEVYVRRNDRLVPVSSMGKLQMGDTIYRPLNDGDIVLINRPPSIHQHSLIALSVKVLPVNSVLSINPLICSPFRGDFDGDCLHGYIPQSTNSRAELHELVALDKQLINGQSGRNLLSLSQDSLTAAHMILEDGVLLDHIQMQQLQMLYPDQLKTCSLETNTCSWTGKQLFSMFLPQDFDYDFSPEGVQICKGKLLSSPKGSFWLREADGNLFHSLVKHCKGKTLGLLYAAQQVLCEWLSMRGLSVSLSDFYLTPDLYSRKNMIEEVFCGLQEAERISNIKLLMVRENEDFLSGIEKGLNDRYFGSEHMCYKKQRLAALSQVSVSAFKQVFWDIQNLVYRYASKENSLIVMLKAGSKGNLAKLVQHSMCLGLQHSLVPLNFRMPHQLSCAAWNQHKGCASSDMTSDGLEYSGPYIPYAVVETSFLTGLNPLECFVHSLTARDSSFSENADLPGTLTRRLMFFMRDLYMAYDGTVRNAHGNHLVQFSYNIKETSSLSNDADDSFDDTACAISEAAYSALDQPVSVLEASPLLNIKKILECGVKSRSGNKTASLFLSKKLGRLAYGFEYGALEVQRHLERVFFSDVVSTVMIYYSPQTGSRARISPWVCHFHIYKDMAKRKRLNMHSVVNALNMKCKSTGARSKTNLPNMQIMCRNCLLDGMKEEQNATYCITVTVVESSRNSVVQLDTLQNMVIPSLFGTVIKGFPEFKKVDILWKDGPSTSRSHKTSGELYLRVFMSEYCDRQKFWSAILDNCLQIMDMIDWQCSHPDDIHDLTSAYGIDVAEKCFLDDLKSAISDMGKIILPEHLQLVADCLSSTGEFVSLNAKGLTVQRKQTSVSSPFTLACFSNPADCLIRAAKKGVLDDLQGSIDALSWGKVPSVGAGGRFDILYSGKGHEIVKSENIYGLLGSHVRSREQNINIKLPCTRTLRASNGCKNFEISKKILRSFITPKDIMRISDALRCMLHKYPVNHRLTDTDKTIAMMALYFHPRRTEKVGSGVQDIKIGYHMEYGNSRCFLLVRIDGTVEDFSYRKCIHHALEEIAPDRATSYQSKWLSRGNGKFLPQILSP